MAFFSCFRLSSFRDSYLCKLKSSAARLSGGVLFCAEVVVMNVQRAVFLLALFTAAGFSRSSKAAEDVDLANKALGVLQTHCYRCHGKDGSLEGGMSFVLDRDKLINRKKIIPGE